MSGQKSDSTYNIYNGVLFSHKKEWNLIICNHTDGARGCYIKWNKSESERQMPYNFSYMWNLKSKISRQMKQTDS